MKYSSLIFENEEWNLKITPQPVYDHISGLDKRIDIVVQQLSSFVSHGIVGQSFNHNTPLFGKTDDYSVNAKYITTTAMGEGAIEGNASDYIMSSIYETKFKYDLFSL